jgi:hypothetical protein
MAAAGGSLKRGLSTPQIIAFTMISSGPRKDGLNGRPVVV